MADEGRAWCILEQTTHKVDVKKGRLAARWVITDGKGMLLMLQVRSTEQNCLKQLGVAGEAICLRDRIIQRYLFTELNQYSIMKPSQTNLHYSVRGYSVSHQKSRYRCHGKTEMQTRQGEM